MMALSHDPAPRLDIDDPELLERCRRGDHAALEHVFTVVAPTLERLLRRMIGPRAEIDDLLQITFMGVMKAFPRFRGEASVRTWMCRIAVRSAVDYLRKPEQKRPHLQLVGEGPEHAHDDHRIDERRCLERVYEHLESIGTKKRVAFILHVFDGHPLEDVAALTGATRAATKSRVFWARRELLAKAKRDPVLRELLEELS